MEVILFLFIFVTFIAGLIFYKSSISRNAVYVEQIVTTNIIESQAELNRRAKAAYEKMIEECGEDFITPEEAYQKMMKLRRRELNQQPKKK